MKRNKMCNRSNIQNEPHNTNILTISIKEQKENGKNPHTQYPWDILK